VEKEVTKVVKETVVKEVVKEVQVPAKAEMITLRVQTYGGSGGIKQREFGGVFADANANVDVKFEETVYREIARETDLSFASGTAQDVLYGHTRWHWMGSAKGYYRPIDDLLATGIIPDYDDFYEVVVDNEKWEGKTDCILDYFHCGGNILLTWNRNMLQERGVDPPEAGFTMMDLADAARQCTDTDKGIFGVYLSGMWSHIYSENVIRAWGKPEYGPDGDTSGWTVQPGGKIFKWYEHPGPTAFYNEWFRPLLEERVHPLTADDVEGGLFVANRAAFMATAVSGPAGYKLRVGDQWDYHTEDTILLPVGPDGRQGTCHSANMMFVASSTKYPEEALRLIGAMTSTEAGVWATLTHGSTTVARQSVVTHPNMVAYNPAVVLIDALASQRGRVEPYPMPWNLRHYELTDIFQNTTDPLYQITGTWEQHAPIVQEECQKLMDQPRP
jgi:multiple sugar transport system substrate-binding protein